MRGVTVVLSRNFRKILSVLPKERKADEIRECLKSSRHMQHVKSIKMETDMWGIMSNDGMSEEFPQKDYYSLEKAELLWTMWTT